MNELVIDDFLDERSLRGLDYYYGNFVSFGWKSSYNNAYDFGHWSRNIIKKSKSIIIDAKDTPNFFTKHCLISSISEKIEEIIGKRGIYRSYFKYYTYGTDAYQHTDVSNNLPWDDNCETAILYLTKNWNPDWYGMTNLYEDNDFDIYKSVMPKHNRLFVFDGKIKHSATPLSRSCPVPKKILVINFMPVDKTDECYLVLKNILDVHDFQHSGRSLMDHLYGTYLLLDAYEDKLPTFVKKAGLYHNIYGTESYHHTNELKLPRSFVRNLIGEEAENLVYDFCNMKGNRTKKIIEGDNIYLKFIELTNLTEQFRYIASEKTEKRLNELNEQCQEYLRENAKV